MSCYRNYLGPLVLMVAAAVMFVLLNMAHGASEKETVAAAGSTSRPACGLGTSPSCPRGVYAPLGILAPGLTLGLAADAPAEPPVAKGLGTSPSLPATGGWYAAAALFLIPLIGVARKSPKVQRFFETDGWGSLSSFVVAMVYTFGEALARGESPSWVLVKHAFGLTAAMFLGYSGIWKRIAAPLLRKLVKAMGFKLPGWLEETARVENVTVVGGIEAKPGQHLTVRNSDFKTGSPSAAIYAPPDVSMKIIGNRFTDGGGS
jgi:hypothetical protein